MKKNELTALNKYTLKYIAVALGLIAIDMVTFNISDKLIKEKKYYTNEDRYYERINSGFDESSSNRLLTLCALLLISSFYLILQYGFVIPCKAYGFANKTARKYLKEMFKQDKQLRSFEYLLNDKFALDKIALFISKKLPAQYNDKIMEIVQRYDEKDNFVQMRNDIVALLQNYTKQNPEFIQELSSLLASCRKTYIIQPQQRTR